MFAPEFAFFLVSPHLKNSSNQLRVRKDLSTQPCPKTFIAVNWSCKPSNKTTKSTKTQLVTLVWQRWSLQLGSAIELNSTPLLIRKVLLSQSNSNFANANSCTTLCLRSMEDSEIPPTEHQAHTPTQPSNSTSAPRDSTTKSTTCSTNHQKNS